MLYVEFDNGVVEKHKIDHGTWVNEGSMILWLLYDPRELYYIERFFYIAPPDRGLKNSATILTRLSSNKT